MVKCLLSAKCYLLFRFSQQKPSVLTVLPNVFCILNDIGIFLLTLLNLVKEAHPSMIYLEWCHISLSGYLFSLPVGARSQSDWHIKNDTFFFPEDILLHYSKCFLRLYKIFYLDNLKWQVFVLLCIFTRYPVELDSSGLLIIVVLEFFSYVFLVKTQSSWVVPA